MMLSTERKGGRRRATPVGCIEDESHVSQVDYYYSRVQRGEVHHI